MDSEKTQVESPIVVPDDPEKNIRGRLWYLEAVRSHILGFWESLKNDVFYQCDFFEYVAAKQPIPERVHERAQTCFDEWLVAWGIVDEWLMDACRHTLSCWAELVHHDGRGALDGRWPVPVWYAPGESNLSVLKDFAPALEQPHPIALYTLSEEEETILSHDPMALRIHEARVPRESGKAFKRRMKKQFDEQLDDYIAQYEARMLEHSKIARDAAWTALFQFGESPKKIEAWESRRSGENVSYARIQQAIQKFAQSIGLTLRKPRAGRRAKQPKTSNRQG